MPCANCSKDVYFDRFCKHHFCNIMEQRIRKEFRVNELVKKGDILVIKDPFCEQLAKKILKDLPVTIIKTAKTNTKNAKEIIPWTMEEELISFLESFLSGSNLPELGHTKKRIKMFLRLRHAEAKAFAKALGFVFNEAPEGKLAELLQELEDKYPSSKYSFLKSIEELSKVIR